MNVEALNGALHGAGRYGVDVEIMVMIGAVLGVVGILRSHSALRGGCVRILPYLNPHL